MFTSLTPRIAAACGVGVLILGVSACGGGDGDDTGTTAEPQDTTLQGEPDMPSRTGFPGADGKVAAVDGNTAQVQSLGRGQVAVTWNDTTTFTKQIDATLDDVKAGVCVMVQAAGSGEAGDGADSGAGATEVAADTVRITEKVDGECGGGLRGGPMSAPGGGEMTLPDGARPEVREFGAAPGGAFGGAFGEVTAVNADGFTVAAAMPRFEEGQDAPTLEEVTVTVTVSGDTTYTTTGAGSAADVETGVCLRAEGTADETGAITARTIALSLATDGECGGMMIRGGPMPGGGSGSTGTTES